MLSRDLTKPPNRRIMQLHGQEPIKVSDGLAKCGSHMHFGSDDKIILVCHVILQDQVIKESCNFIRKSPSK